jgi:hypothetical protein
MSSKNNVNPDHYKVAGRERQGENVLQSVQKQALAEREAAIKRLRSRQPAAAVKRNAAEAATEEDSKAGQRLEISERRRPRSDGDRRVSARRSQGQRPRNR